MIPSIFIHFGEDIENSENSDIINTSYDQGEDYDKYKERHKDL
ncbi:hypothetical protein [Erysipelothrix piscisicarius]|nr:hypothetical protein [Erysipelothrix piscisicarius]